MPDPVATDLAYQGGPQSWAKALHVAACLAFAQASPHRTSILGVRVLAGAGPVRDAWIANFAALTGSQPITIPPDTPLSRLLPSVDLSASLVAGRPVNDPGLLAASDGRWLMLTGAERLPQDTAAVIAARLERHDDKPPLLVTLDEGIDGDDCPSAITERLPLTLDLRHVAWHDICCGALEPPATFTQPLQSPDMLAELPDAAAELAATVGLSLGQSSMRATLAICDLARIIAAMDAHRVVSGDDMASAIEMVCGPVFSDDRQTEPAETEQNQPRQDAQSETQNDSEADQRHDERKDDSEADERPESIDFQALQEMLIDAVQTGRLELPMHIERARQPGTSRQDGKSGAMKKGARRGRPMGVAAKPPYRGARLDVISTLRAAAPWQTIRRTVYASSRDERVSDKGLPRPIIKPSDYRFIRYKQATESVAIFAVDASGSTALDRLAEAKGAVERLLGDCYVRRDSVALIAFRGTTSSVILEPTRSLVRAKRSLTALPGGGGTPLAAGLKGATELALSARGKGKTPLLVILTDGRGNIALDGTADRNAAARDSERIAALAAAQGIKTVFIDIARRPRDSARSLASKMAADYCALPRLDAGQVSTIVNSYMDVRGRP